MTFIISFLLFLNIVAVVAIDIAAWWLIGWQIGIAGLISIISFIIAYGLSVEAALSPRDFFVNSEWDIFVKKLGWAWSVTAIVYALSYMAIAYFFGDVIGVMPADFHY